MALNVSMSSDYPSEAKGGHFYLLQPVFLKGQDHNSKTTYVRSFYLLTEKARATFIYVVETAVEISV